jgi:polar amino acid transport system substrate-binding protein
MHQALRHKPLKYMTAIRVVGLLAACAIGLMLNAAAPARAFTAEQVDKGREVFRLQCARCHGPDGQGISNIYRGMTAPPLIGPTALPLNPRSYQKMRHFQFRTVRDVYEFASAVMPADQPASLSAEDYWDAIAYLLNANGMAVNGQLLNENVAADMALAPLQERARQAGANEAPLPAPAGNAPVIEGEGASAK